MCVACVAVFFAASTRCYCGRRIELDDVSEFNVYINHYAIIVLTEGISELFELISPSSLGQLEVSVKGNCAFCLLSAGLLEPQVALRVLKIMSVERDNVVWSTLLRLIDWLSMLLADYDQSLETYELWRVSDMQSMSSAIQ